MLKIGTHVRLDDGETGTTAAATKYVGQGLYIGQWEKHGGPEGNLRSSDFDMVYGPLVRYASAADPEKFVGTFATYPEIREG